MKNGNPLFTIINADIAVGPVLTPALLRILKTLGFASVVSAACNADFAEGDHQAPQVALAVEAASLPYHDLPEDPDAASKRLAELFGVLPKPIYLFAGDEGDAAEIWATAVTGTIEEPVIRHALARVGRVPATIVANKLAS